MKRNEQTKRFNKLLDEIKEIHANKNHDYATNEDSLSNLKLCKTLIGIPSWIGCVVRMLDKVSRVAEFARKGELKVKSENIRETFIDLAVYSLLCVILMEEEEE